VHNVKRLHIVPRPTSSAGRLDVVQLVTSLCAHPGRTRMLADLSSHPPGPIWKAQRVCPSGGSTCRDIHASLVQEVVGNVMDERGQGRWRR
jgi:hypothetical protein